MNTNQSSRPLRFFLRKIDQPFECRCSPLYTDELKKEHLAWATDHCAMKEGSKAHTHTVSSDITQWIALSFPLATDLAKFKDVYYFFQMFSAMDDHADEQWGDALAQGTDGVKTFWEKAIALLEMLRDGSSHSPKRPTDVSDIPSYMMENFKYMKTILDRLNPVQRNRYINAFKTYMVNASLQSQLIGKTGRVTMEQYKEYRVKSIASMPCTLMMEYLYGIELTDEEYNHPQLQQLEKTGTLQVAFINDLFSIFKEYNGSLDELNHPLTLLVQNEGMDIQQGIDEICRMVEEFQTIFIESRDAWFESGEPVSENVRRFVKGFEYYMAGNDNWSRLSRRYHGRAFTAKITSGMLEWSPQGTLYTPAQSEVFSAS